MLAFLRSHAHLLAQGMKLVSALQPELEGVAQVIETGVHQVDPIIRTAVRLK